jgi:hypothetical protein
MFHLIQVRRKSFTALVVLCCPFGFGLSIEKHDEGHTGVILTPTSWVPAAYEWYREIEE